jgi:hypothetical protein
MKVLTLARRNSHLQHSHGIVFKKHTVISWSGDQRLKVRWPFGLMYLGH